MSKMISKETKQGQLFWPSLFYLSLSVGCFWQILNICKLYFNYPTNVFIETRFEAFSQTLPAPTFCTNIMTYNSGKNSSSALDIYSKEFKENTFHTIQMCN